jgi:MYXO-CTERM domain-containing protein
VSYLNTKAGENRAGEIIDADIEFNAVHFAISANDATEADPSLCKSDLANTLTHEVGHLMGLDHTCVANGYSPGFNPDGNPKPWPLDDNGAEVPYCSEGDLTQEIIDSTMNAFQSCGETIKATPEADDIDGVCGVYPLAEDPGECALPEPLGKRTCACRVGTADNGSPVAPLIPLLVLGLVLVRVRSRRQG